jgi:Ca-activated chloride channel homolog
MTDLSFLAPTRLALLLVPAALAVGYLLLAARRRRYAVRFTSLDLLDEVAPDRPGWRRTLPAGLLLLGLVVAAVAVARPAVADEVLRERDGLVVLALDTSLSMQAEDVAPSRLVAAKDAAGRFLDTVPDGVAVGVVGFDETARELISPTTNLEAVRRVIDRLQLGQGTAIGDAIVTAVDTVERFRVDEGPEPTPSAAGGEGAPGEAEAPGTVVVLSDGETTQGRPTADGAAAAARRGIRVNTIAFGTDEGTVVAPDGSTIPVPVNRAALEDAATSTGGSYFPAYTAEQLTEVFEGLGTAVETEPTQREVTDLVALAALILVALAAMGSLAWAGRLP